MSTGESRHWKQTSTPLASTLLLPDQQAVLRAPDGSEEWPELTHS